MPEEEKEKEEENENEENPYELLIKRYTKKSSVTDRIPPAIVRSELPQALSIGRARIIEDIKEVSIKSYSK